MADQHDADRHDADQHDADPVELAGAPLLEQAFSRPQITDIRHAVATRVARAGLGGDRLDGFVLAVNEIITNVVLHAGGAGRIRLWIDRGSAYCAVADEGPGIPDRYLAGDRLPSAFAIGGRGIWLAHQLCDSVIVRTDSSGSTVIMVSRLPGRAGCGDLATGAAAAGG
jgi:anti-sigma regulatory factor (Ser/Thr protein kinase)